MRNQVTNKTSEKRMCVCVCVCVCVYTLLLELEFAEEEARHVLDAFVSILETQRHFAHLPANLDHIVED